MMIKAILKKRKLSIVSDCQYQKRQKKDPSAKSECVKLSKNIKQVNDKVKGTQYTKQNCYKDKPFMSCEEKASLKKEFLEAITINLSGPLRGFLRKHGFVYSMKEKIERAFDSFDDNTLQELIRVLRGSLGAINRATTSDILSQTSTGKDQEDYTETQNKNEILDSQTHEENLNIKTRIRDAKEALFKKSNSDLQKKREREREKLEKMEKTTIMGDNLTVLRELEKFCNYSLSLYYPQKQEQFKNPLERIGLCLKKEYNYYDDSSIDHDLEEGEIF